MTVVAGIAAGYMSWMLARGNDAVVTAVAAADNLCVVHHEDRCNDVGVVAILANITGLNVRQVLTHRLDAVMAVNTVAGDIQMVEVSR